MADTIDPNSPDNQAPARPPQRGGGCLIAGGLILGPALGLAVGQTSAGLVIGGVVGVIAAIVLTIVDRRS